MRALDLFQEQQETPGLRQRVADVRQTLQAAALEITTAVVRMNELAGSIAAGAGATRLVSPSAEADLAKAEALVRKHARAVEQTKKPLADAMEAVGNAQKILAGSVKE